MEKKTTLYELDQTIRTILENGFMLDEETGEYRGAEDLEALGVERATKIENVAIYVKELEAFSEKLSDESKRYAERAKSYANKADRIREYLIGSMVEAGEKTFETVKVKLGVRSSQRVETDDMLPNEYIVAKLVTAYSLQIK